MKTAVCWPGTTPGAGNKIFKDIFRVRKQYLWHKKKSWSKFKFPIITMIIFYLPLNAIEMFLKQSWSKYRWIIISVKCVKCFGFSVSILNENKWRFVELNNILRLQYYIYRYWCGEWNVYNSVVWCVGSRYCIVVRHNLLTDSGDVLNFAV